MVGESVILQLLFAPSETVLYINIYFFIFIYEHKLREMSMEVVSSYCFFSSSDSGSRLHPNALSPFHSFGRHSDLTATFTSPSRGKRKRSEFEGSEDLPCAYGPSSMDESTDEDPGIPFTPNCSNKENVLRDSDPESNHPSKQRKTEHRAPNSKDLPSCRFVLVRFGDEGTLKGEMLYREPWGCMVLITETNPSLPHVRLRSQFWASWKGMLCTQTSIPIVHAIHQS
jgi:hypothetical protein